MPPQRAEREQHRGLHLDGEDPPLRPARGLARVGVVEDVAGDDRSDAQRLAEVLRVVHGPVDELEVGRRRVRLAADVVHRGRVGGTGGDSAITRSPIARSGCRPPQVPTRMSFLTPSWTSSSITIAADGQPMPARLHRDRLALERPGVPEHPAFAVALARRPRRRSRRCTSPAGGRPGEGRPRRSRPGRRARGSAWRGSYAIRRATSQCADAGRLREFRVSVKLIDPSRARSSRFCARGSRRARVPRGRGAAGAGAVRGCSSETASSSALCHLGANLVPSGRGCDAFAEPRRCARARGW